MDGSEASWGGGSIRKDGPTRFKPWRRPWLQPSSSSGLVDRSEFDEVAVVEKGRGAVVGCGRM